MSYFFIFINFRNERSSYGDDAVGYVRIKRVNNLCNVSAKLTAEHKCRTNYAVLCVVNERLQRIISCECEGCAASAGK